MNKVAWLGSSRDDLLEFPEKARKDVGFAIYVAETGGKHPKSKPLKGFQGAGVLEIVESHDGNAYRAVYTVRFEGWLYVLHCFQKKSRTGISTPQSDMELIRRRLREAQEQHKQWKNERE